MDTVQEEYSPASTPEESQPLYKTPERLEVPKLHDGGSQEHLASASPSRRHSAIIAALRRPSQAIALSAAHAVMTQRRYFMSLFQAQSDRSIQGEGNNDCADEETLRNRQLGDDALTKILSALYAKLLVVLGMAFPITEIISPTVRPFFYQGFYLYLYLGSIIFVAYMYGTLMKEKAVSSVLNSYQKDLTSDLPFLEKKHDKHPVRYGSFYLRLGAIAFGIGSMVYSGLEFGRYFELKSNEHCYSTILQAITPATRMLLTLLQIQFIFLNSQDIEINRYRIVSRFGLMHMIATNLCEWLYVLVEETKHEIIHLEERHNSSKHAKFCFEGHVMGSLVTNASPFLFPCKIEYSLICAVILFEMWKEIKSKYKEQHGADTQNSNNNNNNTNKHSHSSNHHNHFSFHIFGSAMQSQHHFTVDCSKAHKGLFAGILVIVLTIISLIMFFVLTSQPGSHQEKTTYLNHAEFEVQIVELILYIISTISVVIAMLKMRSMKYCRKSNDGQLSGLGLDNTLLVVAQTGMFIYCMFSIIGCYFRTATNSTMGLVAEAFSFSQTCLQTIFVLDGWWRRCRNLEQAKKKPGRELVTFLIISNMAMWTINVLVKNRAEFRPTHLEFYGEWAWTIITHISMPLAIFYRFHSTICLFEIWKSAFKLKPPYKTPLLPYL